jgi:hypothetical protein
MADPPLIAPCEPGAPAAPHHVHRAAHIIGRIRRHSTRRVARRLHAPLGGCLPGAPVSLLRLALPAVGNVAAGSIAVGAIAAGAVAVTRAASRGVSAQTGPVGPGGAGGGIAGGAPVGTVTIGKPGHHHVVTVQEPQSATLLLIGMVACAGLIRWFRPGRVRRT